MTQPVTISGAVEAPSEILLDVRPMLAAGEDPLSHVLQAVAGMPLGGTLVVDAPFNPSPLRRLLAGRGFSSLGRNLGNGHWRISFLNDGAGTWDQDTDVSVGPEGAMSWCEADGIHIDVRRLVPPQPMLAILRLLDGLGDGRAVIVHHDRMPHLLIPELAERGWRLTRQAEQFAEIRLWLERGP